MLESDSDPCFISAYERFREISNSRSVTFRGVPLFWASLGDEASFTPTEGMLFRMRIVIIQLLSYWELDSACSTHVNVFRILVGSQSEKDV